MIVFARPGVTLSADNLRILDDNPSYRILSGNVKDLNSTVAKKGSVFIELMTSDGAICLEHQRAVFMK